MAAKTSKIATGQKITPISQPSFFWTRRKLWDGTNSRQLTIPDADLRNKWVVLTGGNSGIGKEAALQFAKWGANIILGCRQPPPHEMHPDIAAEETKAAALGAGHSGTVIEWWEVDMSKLESVEAFAKRWLATGHPLDILANNAGIGRDFGKRQMTSDGFQLVHQVNFLAHVYLTMFLLPSLTQARRPRIICTTSCMQYLGEFDLKNTTSTHNAYPNNKLYFQTWLTELQYRMSRHENYKHVTIQGVHPGFVKTNIWVLPRKGNSISWAERATGVVLNWFAIDAQQGSLAITNAATALECSSDSDEPQVGSKVNEEGGRYFNRIWDEEPMPQTKNPECRRQIWEYVCKVLKLEEKGLLKDLNLQRD